MTTRANDPKREETPSFEIPIQPLTPEGIQTRFSNNFYIQQTDGGFYLSFFETVPPIFGGPIEKFPEFAEELGSLKSVCIARIFLPSSRLEIFLDTFIEQFNAHVEMNESGRLLSSPKKPRPKS